MANFNLIAPFYDRLVSVVFGSKLWEAQQAHLQLIRPTDQVLILGGGTGKILERLPACQITFLEKSEKMIVRAKGRHKAQFIHADFFTWRKTSQKFDWIICPFFLDCFDRKYLELSLDLVKDLLQTSGHLMVSDFKQQTASQRILVKLMLLFFRVTTGLQARSLQDIREVVLQKGFEPSVQVEFLDGLVFSDIYLLRK